MTRDDVYRQINQEWHPVLDNMSDNDLSQMLSHDQNEWGNILGHAKNIILDRQRQQQQQNVLANNNTSAIQIGGTGVTNTSFSPSNNNNSTVSTSKRSHSRYSNSNTTREEPVEKVEEVEPVHFFEKNEEKPIETGTDINDFEKVIKGYYQMNMDKHKTIISRAVTTGKIRTLSKQQVDTVSALEEGDVKLDIMLPDLTYFHRVADGPLIHTVDSLLSIPSYITLLESHLAEMNDKRKEGEKKYNFYATRIVSLAEMMFSSIVNAPEKKDLLDISTEMDSLDLPHRLSALNALRERFVMENKDQLMANAVSAVIDVLDHWMTISLKLSGERIHYTDLVEDAPDILLRAKDIVRTSESVMLPINGDPIGLAHEEIYSYIEEGSYLVAIPMYSMVMYTTLSHTDMHLSAMEIGSTTVLNSNFHRDIIKMVEEIHRLDHSIITLITRDSTCFYINKSVDSDMSWRIHRSH